MLGAIVLLAIVVFWYLKEKRTNQPEVKKTNTEMSPDLIKANELTKEVFRYVELVETNQMSQEEANKLSNPVKVELQQLRSRLSPEELKKNDAMRKALGDIMVNNVMKYRNEKAAKPGN